MFSQKEASQKSWMNGFARFDFLFIFVLLGFVSLAFYDSENRVQQVTSLQYAVQSALAQSATSTSCLGENPLPHAQLDVIPNLIPVDGVCFVAWSSSDVVECEITGFGIDSEAFSGGQFTPEMTDSALYKIACVGLDGNLYTDSDRCHVNPDIRED